MNKGIFLAGFVLLVFAAGFIGLARADLTSAHVGVSLVSQTPDPAKSGEIVELRFLVENTGSQATKDLEFRLITEYPFTEIPGEDYVKKVNALRPYQQGADGVTLKYKVRVDRDAVKGYSNIELKRSEEGSDIAVTDSFSVEITGAEYAQIIYVDKSIITPGEETPLTFTITNVGTSPLQNLVFSWNEENGVILPVYSDDTKYIKYIDVEESVDAEYTVVADVNTVPGLYQLDLTLTFEAESGTSQEMNTKAGIFIGGQTDFDVTFSESSAGQTSLSVANTGNNPAYSVTVRIPDQENFAVSGSTSSIIGNLDRGDYTIVSFQISQSRPSTGFRINRTAEAGEQPDVPSQSSSLGVLIEYTDTAGKRHSIEKSVPIQFRSISTDTTGTASAGTATEYAAFRQRANPFASWIPYAALAVVIVAGAVCYRKREYLRKRFRKKKKE